MTYKYITKNIEQIKKYTKFLVEPLKNEYYKNSKNFQNFCEKFLINIDKFNSKSQILIMILFYLHLDSNNTQNIQAYAYHNIRFIQLFF